MDPYVYYSTLSETQFPKTAIFKYLLPPTPRDSVIPSYEDTTSAYIDGLTGESISRGQLRHESLRFVRGFNALGLRRGDTACLWGLNSLHWVRTAFGLMAGGIIVSPANAAYEPKEIAHQINDSGSTVLFIDPSALPRLNAARQYLKRELPDSRVVLLCKRSELPPGSSHPCLYDLLASRPEVTQQFEGDDAHSTAWLCYSSGTTGLPKGVCTTQHNVVSQLQAMHFGGEPLHHGRDVALGVLPFSHIYGLVIVMMGPLTRGVPLVVFPRYAENQVLPAIAKYNVSFASFVPPIVLSLVNSPTAQNYDLSSVRGVLCGAAPLSAELIDRFQKRYPHATIVQAYGMTEASPGITAMPIAVAKGHAGTVGWILPGFAVRLVREDGTDARPGESGEMWARGPCIMKGYHNNPEATSSALAVDDEGQHWYRTGDILMSPDNVFFWCVDRLKELIKYKGFQVPPAELEATLLQHPEVNDVGVVGVYDEEQATELPRAYIVPAPGVRGGKEFGEKVADWLANHVAQHKRLRGGVVVVSEIPKSPSGKILRKDLRDRAKIEFAKERGEPQAAKL